MKYEMVNLRERLENLLVNLTIQRGEDEEKGYLYKVFITNKITPCLTAVTDKGGFI